MALFRGEQMSKLLQIMQANWKELVIAIFMVFVGYELIQIRSELNSIESDVSSIESRIPY